MKVAKSSVDFCECSCGLSVKNGSMFLRGHNLRLRNPTPKGSRRSEKVKKKISITNSIRVKELWKDSEYRRNHVVSIRESRKYMKKSRYWLGKKFSKEHCNNLHIDHKEQRNPNKGKFLVPRETRVCLCGCRQIFKCSINSKRQFIHGHNLMTYRREKNFSWARGKSFEEYGFGWTQELREFIRKRDGYRCQECGAHQREFTKKLSVHHIDYNKKNCKEWNLITLCNSCSTKVNFDRKNWEQYFKRLLKEKRRYEEDSLYIV